MLSQRNQGFNEGLQAAIVYFDGVAAGIMRMTDKLGAAQARAILIMIRAYQSDLRRMMKRNNRGKRNGGQA